MKQMPIPASRDVISLSAPHVCPDDNQASPPAPVFRVLTFGAVALLAGIGTVVGMSQIGEVNLTGFLRAEQAVIYAPRAGRVESVMVRTGDSVKPRQTLLQMADDTLDREVAAKTREVRSLQAALEQCRANAEVQMTLQLKDLDEQLHRTRLQSAEYLREQYALNFQHFAWKSLSKDPSNGRLLGVTADAWTEPHRLFDAFLAEPVVAPEDTRVRAMVLHEDARNSAEVKKAQADLCDHHICQLEKLRENLPEQIRRAAGVDVAEAKLESAAEQLEALTHQKSAMSIATPAYGVVGAYAKQVADPVASGEPLVTVLDRDRPFVEVDVPSRQVGKLELGRKVRLAIANEELTGRIDAVSPQAHRQEGSQDSCITVRIRPAGRLWPEVAVGSAVSVRWK